MGREQERRRVKNVSVPEEQMSNLGPLLSGGQSWSFLRPRAEVKEEFAH